MSSKQVPSNVLRLAYLGVILLWFSLVCVRQCSASRAGGYALQFTDDMATASFKDFPLQEMTFEAWISTSDMCHSHGTILSFASNKSSGNQAADMNAFVIADPFAVVACRGYEFVYPTSYWYSSYEEDESSCATNVWDQTESLYYDHHDQRDNNLYSRDGSWHHLAVTFKNYGRTDVYKIYVDGLLVNTAEDVGGSKSNNPDQSEGMLVLGSDQDCIAGCTSTSQSYYGLMDEVKIWKKELTEEQILMNMRIPVDTNQIPSDLVAYWTFDTLLDDNKTPDLTGNGHDLLLKQEPFPVTPDQTLGLRSQMMLFKNSFALNASVSNMPAQDFTIEFWAQTPAIGSDSQYKQPGIFSFASVDPGNGNVSDDEWRQDAEFLSEAIAISKHNTDYWSDKVGLSKNRTVSTVGAVSLHVNDYEIIFLANWTDTAYHHIAATWVYSTGESRLYFDDVELKPYAVIPPQVDSPLEAALNLDPDVSAEDDEYGYDDYYYDYYDDYYDYYGIDSIFDWLFGYDYYDYDTDGDNYNSAYLRGKTGRNFRTLKDLVDEFNKETTKGYKDIFGGKDPSRMSNRSSTGSLVLGQLQRSYGAGFTPRLAYTGQLGNVRVWSLALTFDRIKRNMNLDLPYDRSGLVMEYDMNIVNKQLVEEVSGVNNLRLGGGGPKRRLSYAPLASETGIAVQRQTTPTGGYALRLHDQVTVLRPQMNNFPSKNITVEFWMQSTDTCRYGTPFSYATGEFLSEEDTGLKDNSFTILNYNSWDVQVVNEYGKDQEDPVGVGATDGNWHHVAVTWSSRTGATVIYQDGKLLYRMRRAKGMSIDPDGTLVIGREQDCRGGCFDSDYGSTGDVDSQSFFGTYIQDFYGLIDEMRVWNRTLPPSEVYAHYRKDSFRLTQKVNADRDMQINKQGLVASWSFDEGQGFIIKDSSGNGNDLYISGRPSWEPVIINSVCGNGQLEEVEQCDDSNKVSGDGCSSQCRIEGGFTCTAESPSVCTRISQATLTASKRSSEEPEKSRKKSNGGAIAAAILIPLLFVILIAGLYIFRYRIYEQFPWVEDKVQRIFSKSRTLHYYGELDTDQKEPYLPVEVQPVFAAKVENQDNLFTGITSTDKQESP